MATGDEIDVPDDVVVRCPLVRFDLRQAKRCDGCTHFGGLTESIGNPSLPFHRRFAVNCRFGLDRELFRLAPEDA